MEQTLYEQYNLHVHRCTNVKIGLHSMTTLNFPLQCGTNVSCMSHANMVNQYNENIFHFSDQI